MASCGVSAREQPLFYKASAHKQGVEIRSSAEYGELRIHLRVSPGQR
jgi:hypothetical protein